LVEAQAQVLRAAGGRCQGGIAVSEQLEGLMVDSGLGGRGVFGRAEGQAAHEDRRQRLGLHLQPVGADLHVDAAGVPEPRVEGDERVVGRLHEDIDVHAPAVGLDGIGHHLAHRNAPKIDR